MVGEPVGSLPDPRCFRALTWTARLFLEWLGSLGAFFTSATEFWPIMSGTLELRMRPPKIS